LARNVKVFRLNFFPWWAGNDLASVNSAYLAEAGMAKEGASEEEEGFPKDAMETARIYPNLQAKESTTFQEELAAWWLKVKSSLVTSLVGSLSQIGLRMRLLSRAALS
jgi:hypothetical protein